MDQQAPAFAYVAADMRRHCYPRIGGMAHGRRRRDMGNLLGPAVEAEGISAGACGATGTRGHVWIIRVINVNTLPSTQFVDIC